MQQPQTPLNNIFDVGCAHRWCAFNVTLVFKFADFLTAEDYIFPNVTVVTMVTIQIAPGSLSVSSSQPSPSSHNSFLSGYCQQLCCVAIVGR